ncbi:hypothetical protein ACFL02_03585 [Planctomycetota bacterium]
MSRFKKKHIWMLGAVLILLFISVLAYKWHVKTDPENAFEEFCFAKGFAEDQLMDPLILAGEEVIPIVIESVKNHATPRRRSAIGFLGNAKADKALPTLVTILNDEAEPNYIRADALIAIAMIKLSKGKELSKRFEQNEGFLGYIAKKVLSEERQLLQRRTFFDALFRRHY